MNLKLRGRALKPSSGSSASLSLKVEGAGLRRKPDRCSSEVDRTLCVCCSRSSGRHLLRANFQPLKQPVRCCSAQMFQQ